MKRLFMNAGSATGVASVGLLFLRLITGGLMLYSHGWPKWTKYADKAESFPDPLGVGSPVRMALAIFSELVCSAFIILGLFTRWSAFVLAFTMVIAAFMIHGDDPLKKKELALMYLAPFLALMFTGAGRVSLDAVLGGKGE